MNNITRWILSAIIWPFVFLLTLNILPMFFHPPSEAPVAMIAVAASYFSIISAVAIAPPHQWKISVTVFSCVVVIFAAVSWVLRNGHNPNGLSLSDGLELFGYLGGIYISVVQVRPRVDDQGHL